MYPLHGLAAVMAITKWSISGPEKRSGLRLFHQPD
jgi:hypothetical protein